jgi:hypothetical protein
MSKSLASKSTLAEGRMRGSKTIRRSTKLCPPPPPVQWGSLFERPRIFSWPVRPKLLD